MKFFPLIFLLIFFSLQSQDYNRFNKKKKLLKQGMVKENGDIYQPQAKIISLLNKKVKNIFNERI